MEPNDGNDEDCKPRKLEETDEIVEYLLSLKDQLATLSPTSDAEDVDILVENVLLETKSRMASAASDRRTNLVIEKIVSLACFNHLRIVIEGFSPYALFLARNRYSSHIIQGVDGMHESEFKEAVSTFANTLLGEISWLVKDVSASHVLRSLLCLLAGVPVLAERKGGESKHQHSVMFSQPMESVLGMVEDGWHVDKQKAFEVPIEFHECLGAGAAAFLSVPPEELHELLAAPSSCAVLGLLLRLLASPGLIEGGPELGERLAAHVFKVQPNASVGVHTEGAMVKSDVDGALGGGEGGGGGEGHFSGFASCGDLFYAMAGDKAASYFLEVALESCPMGLVLTVLEQALGGGGGGGGGVDEGGSGVGAARVAEYVLDGCANFVVQAALRRLGLCIAASASKLLSDAHDTSATAAKKKKKGQAQDAGTAAALTPLQAQLRRAKGLAEALLDCLSSEEMLPGLVERKGGVVLWMLEVAATLPTKAEAVGEAVLGVWTKGGSLPLLQVLTDRLTPVDQAAAAAGAAHARGGAGRGPKFGGAAEGGEGGAGAGKGKGRVPNVNATLLLNAKLVGALLRLRTSRPACAVSKALSSLPAPLLSSTACSGQLSRSVLDTFFDHHTSPSHLSALLTQLATVVGKFGDHFAGQHVFRRAFQCADLEGKEALVQGVVGAGEAFGRSKEGRASLQISHADSYRRSRQGWVDAMRRFQRAELMLKDLESTSDPKPQPQGQGQGQSRPPQGHAMAPLSTRPTAGSNKEGAADEEDEGGVMDTDVVADAAAGGPRKRKRKRPAKGPRSEGDQGPQGGEGGGSPPASDEGGQREQRGGEGGGVGSFTSKKLKAAAGEARERNGSEGDIAPSAALEHKDKDKKGRDKLQAMGPGDRKGGGGGRGDREEGKGKGKGKADMTMISKLKSAKILNAALIRQEIDTLQKEKVKDKVKS